MADGLYTHEQVKKFMLLYHEVQGTERDASELAFSSGDGINVAVKYEKALEMPVELRDESYNNILRIMEEAIELRKKN